MQQRSAHHDGSEYYVLDTCIKFKCDPLKHADCNSALSRHDPVCSNAACVPGPNQAAMHKQFACLAILNRWGDCNTSALHVILCPPEANATSPLTHIAETVDGDDEEEDEEAEEEENDNPDQADGEELEQIRKLEQGTKRKIVKNKKITKKPKRAVAAA